MPKHIKPRPELIVSGDVFMEAVGGRSGTQNMQNDSLSISEAVDDDVFLPTTLDVSHILRVFAPFSTFEYL